MCIMNDGTLGLHPIKENTRMRVKMNFDENSGSYYFLPYRQQVQVMGSIHAKVDGYLKPLETSTER